MELGEEEKRQLRKIIEQTGYIPPGLKDHAIAKKLLYKKAGPVCKRPARPGNTDWWRL